MASNGETTIPVSCDAGASHSTRYFCGDGTFDFGRSQARSREMSGPVTKCYLDGSFSGSLARSGCSVRDSLAKECARTRSDTGSDQPSHCAKDTSRGEVSICRNIDERFIVELALVV